MIERLKDSDIVPFSKSSHPHTIYSLTKGIVEHLNNPPILEISL